jgi:hypothetical protein
VDSVATENTEGNPMPMFFEDQHFAERSATVLHPISTSDKTALAGLRAIVEPDKGRLLGY